MSGGFGIFPRSFEVGYRTLNDRTVNPASKSVVATSITQTYDLPKPHSKRLWKRSNGLRVMIATRLGKILGQPRLGWLSVLSNIHLSPFPSSGGWFFTSTNLTTSLWDPFSGAFKKNDLLAYKRASVIQKKWCRGNSGIQGIDSQPLRSLQ